MAVYYIMVFGETTYLLVYSIGRWVVKNKKGTVINHLLLFV